MVQGQLDKQAAQIAYRELNKENEQKRQKRIQSQMNQVQQKDKNGNENDQQKPTVGGYKQINYEALIAYAQNLINKMLCKAEDFDLRQVTQSGVRTEEDLKMQGLFPKQITTLEQARLICRFLHFKRKPMENREFYEHFFDQQEKANGIEQLKKLKNIISQVQPSQIDMLPAPLKKQATRSPPKDSKDYDEFRDTLGATLTESLNLTNISDCDFSHREKLQILNKLTIDYNNRQNNPDKLQLFELDARKSKQIQKDIKTFILQKHQMNADYELEEVKESLQEVTGKLMSNPRKAQQQKKNMNNLTTRLATPNCIMNKMLDQLDQSIKTKHSTQSKIMNSKQQSLNNTVNNTIRSMTSDDGPFTRNFGSHLEEYVSFDHHRTQMNSEDK